MANNSDSDFSDAGEAHEDEVRQGQRVNKNGVKVRGEGKSWVEIFRFENAEDYKASDIAKKLEKEFSCRKNREFDYADVADYECKFRRRVGFLPCPWRIKVISHKPLCMVPT